MANKAKSLDAQEKIIKKIKNKQNIPIDNKLRCSTYKSSFNYINQDIEIIFDSDIISENYKPETM